ncbi:hypothetical protein GX50_03358 [[Emmonsia] crescens]|uniref:Uncharacterized protein n=1 Tax=[Emmonsia] crescens TaxID=73230 RepID=A0A2B7ZKT3_9EURO|nr:hypothetical protein GX50_03358 [Emmonsia crescens]
MAGKGNSEAARQRFCDFHLVTAAQEPPIKWQLQGMRFLIILGSQVATLSWHVFGGTMEYYRDNTQDNGQCGVPYQLDANGGACKIDPDVINRLFILGAFFIPLFSYMPDTFPTPHANVNMSECSFPFRRIGPMVDRLTMQSMGQHSVNPFHPLQLPAFIGQQGNTLCECLT